MTFGSYIRSYRGIWVAVFSLAVVVAASLKLSNIVPPWPDEGGTGSSAFAVFSCMVGITLGYYIKFSVKKTQRVIGLCLIGVAFVFVLIYAWAHSSLVVVFPQRVDTLEVPRRIVVGLTTNNPVDSDVKSKVLLERYGLDGLAWTDASITLARLILLFSYLLIFLTFTTGLGILKNMEATPKKSLSDKV